MKVSRFCTITLLLIALTTLAAAQTPTLNAVFPPTTSSQPNYTDFNSYVIPNPSVNGVTIGVPWDAIDLSTTTTKTYDFTDWDTANLAQFANTNKVVNLIVLPALEGGVNSYTPSYVFSQTWANGTASWGGSIGGWSSFHKYQPSTYILVGTHYQQEIATVVPSSGYDGHCVSGSTTPTFSTTGGTVTDGTAPTQCKWQDAGTNAPLQQMAVCPAYPGAPNWTASHTYPSSKTITPDSDKYNLHFYENTASCTSGSSEPTWNIGSNTSDGTCTWVDNGTTIPNYQGLPVSYNLPFGRAYRQFAAALYNHYANHAPTGVKIGYIRFGMTQGGESTPECNTAGSASTGWPEFSIYTYLAYIFDMLDYFGSSSVGTSPLPQVADLNAAGAVPNYNYADQEAQRAISDSIGLDTNGLQVNDVTQIQAGNCTVQGSTSGDWCKNFTAYCGSKMSNGNYPICSLQSLLASTPGNDTSGLTGSLSVDGTFPGLIPVAAAHGTTNLEIYTIDTLLATSPNYCSDTGAFCSSPDYSGYQGPYLAAFETFLDQTPGIFSPVPTTTLPSTSSITFDWYQQTGTYPCKLSNMTYGLLGGTSVGGSQYFSVTGLSGSTISYATSALASAPHGSTVYIRWGYIVGSSCGGGGGSGHVDYTYTAP